MPDFDPSSRYARSEIRTYVDDDGREVRYVGRRFLPDGQAQPLLTETVVIEGQRPDLVAHTHLGDPLAWWRVADANNAMDPAELTEEPGVRLRVAVPQADLDD